MSYFLNVTPNEFCGLLVLGDRQYNQNFKVAGNVNRFYQMVAWEVGPYDTSANSTLTINYSFNSGAAYATIAVALTASASTSATQIVTDLNADTSFAAAFTAYLRTDDRPEIRANTNNKESFRAYISNTSAETKLRFNKKCGVAELPSYFARHTIANYVAGTYPDSVGMLVQLSQPGDNTIITDAGLSTTPKADYELMKGRSGLFNFQKVTVDGSDRITQIIEFPAGAVAGDFARKITYSYTSSNTKPDKIAEVPYTLASGDLFTPP